MTRKESLRETIEAQVAEFLARGKVPEEVRPGVSGKIEGEAFPAFTLTDSQLRDPNRDRSLRANFDKARSRANRKPPRGRR